MANKEKMNQMIGEAYENYRKSHTSPPTNPGGPLLSDNLISVRPIQYIQEEFINKCKTDVEFSETWGLKIEERELSYTERCDEYIKTHPIETNDGVLNYKWIGDNLCTHEDYNEWNIPTKLITLTYNNETIESYE